GNVFCAFQSTDGATWNPVGTPVTLALSTTFNLGVAMSSGANSATEAARFSNISISNQMDYQQWKMASGLPADIADNAIPGADGIPVLLKYAYGFAPGAVATSPFAPAGGPSTGVTFTRLSPAPVRYSVQESTNLSNWTDIATLAAGADVWTGPATVTEDTSVTPRKVSVHDGSPFVPPAQKFFRLVVQPSAP
ncbi:MAG TPA: hypothetical protein VK327_07170, partial [Candidatus Paceibacterota bacterium]|nr:hypothetical protein [Candidatus Paceibacterota bacterium]